MTTLIEIFTKLFAALNLSLIVASIVLNPFVLFICVRSKKLRSISTFKLLAFNALNDTIICLAWNYECFTNTYFDLQTPFQSLFYCQWISNFLENTSIDFCAWMLVSVSLDRLLWLNFKKWSTHYFNGPKPLIYSALLLFVIVAVNCNEVFTSGYSFVDANGTLNIVCYANPPDSIQVYAIMAQVDSYVGGLIPIGLLIVINILIIYKATYFNRAQRAAAAATTATSVSFESASTAPSLQSGAHSSGRTNVAVNRRKSQMTRTILIITLLYVFTTLPGLIVSGFFYPQLLPLDYGQMIANLVMVVMFSYPAFSVFTLYLSNKIFAAEVRALFSRSSEKTVSR